MNSHWKKYRGWGQGGSQAQNLLSQCMLVLGLAKVDLGWVPTGMPTACPCDHAGHLPACHHPRGSSDLPVHECLWSKNELPDSLFELLWHWPIRETEGHLITAGWGRSPDPLPPPLWSPLTLTRVPPPILTWILFLFKLIFQCCVSFCWQRSDSIIYIYAFSFYIYHRILNVVSLCYAVGPCYLSVLCIKAWCPAGVGEPSFPLHLLGHHPDAERLGSLVLGPPGL